MPLALNNYTLGTPYEQASGHLHEDLQLIQIAHNQLEETVSAISTSSSGSGILSRTIRIKHPKILTLPSIYIEAVPAPGVNRYLLLHRWTFVLNTQAGGYTINGGADGFSVAYGDWVVDGSTFEHLSASADILIFSGSPYVDTSLAAYPPFSNGPSTYAGIGNQPLKLIADNNGTASFGGGHPANTGKLTVYYSIESTT